ncbi:MAG: hypothetical protein M1834_000401 [Cirrosporium novae-zelandiae]|nr:MAG: hypothetical protein M1834_000401 [Cirrosporium novae-zelandiae]
MKFSILPPSILLLLLSTATSATPSFHHIHTTRQTNQFHIGVETPTSLGTSTSPYAGQTLFLKKHQLVSKNSTDGAAAAYFDADVLKFLKADSTIWSLTIPSSTGPVVVSAADGTEGLGYNLHYEDQDGIGSVDDSFQGWYICPGKGINGLPRLYAAIDSTDGLPDVGCGEVKLDKVDM